MGYKSVDTGKENRPAFTIVLKSLRNSSEATLATIWVLRLLSYIRVLHCNKCFFMWGCSCAVCFFLIASP